MLTRMNELAAALAQQEVMSHHEISERFKKLFGREMSPAERWAFFLPDSTPREQE